MPKQKPLAGKRSLDIVVWVNQQFQCPHRNWCILYLSNSLDCHSLEKSGGRDSIWLCQLGRKNNYSKKRIYLFNEVHILSEMGLVIPVFSGALARCHFCAYPVLSIYLFSHSLICLLTHNYSNAVRLGKITVYGVKVTQSGKSNETTIWTGADRNATVHTTGSNKHFFPLFSCFHVNALFLGFNSCPFTVLTLAAITSLFLRIGQAVANQPIKPRHNHDCFLAVQEVKQQQTTPPLKRAHWHTMPWWLKKKIHHSRSEKWKSMKEIAIISNNVAYSPIKVQVSLWVQTVCSIKTWIWLNVSHSASTETNPLVIGS